ncbi:MAG: hypothetical protein MJ145_05250, partial [Clostridia bacterium]|nr:hypothetical protein [Clostridia bacterium]
MKSIEKLFTGINMSWKKVILISIISAVIVAALNCIPALEGTSFTVPAETLEVWIVLAVIIIWNCDKAVEAMAKCFVFFLISQPLIYLLEVPFKSAGWDLFQYYPYWLVITFLTIPGAFIAFQVKRGDLIATLILSVATVGECYFGVTQLKHCMNNFPNHLLIAIFCFVAAALMIVVMLKGKRERIIAFALCIIVTVASAIFMLYLDPSNNIASYSLPADKEWEVGEYAGPMQVLVVDKEV